MSTHPKSVFKNCMRCGSNHIVYKNDNSLLCKDCHFHHYVNSASAVAILILNDDEELLLTKRAIEPGKGKLDLPGGFVDIGETAEDAVRRELKEELNVSAKSVDYFGSYPNEYVYSGVTIFTLDFAFTVNINDYLNLKAKDDVACFSFYSLNNLPVEDIAFESIREIAKDFRLKCQKLS